MVKRMQGALWLHIAMYILFVCIVCLVTRTHVCFVLLWVDGVLFCADGSQAATLVWALRDYFAPLHPGTPLPPCCPACISRLLPCCDIVNSGTRQPTLGSTCLLAACRVRAEHAGGLAWLGAFGHTYVAVHSFRPWGWNWRGRGCMILRLQACRHSWRTLECNLRSVTCVLYC